ncbi:MAG TPA: glycosyltransferase family 4 protein [Stellaceae bacterium]|nr:glycosyltransferase family 4 protein [Stellaceae bacterium]
MRITLLTSSIAGVGGAERSITLLSKAWVEMGRAVTILTFDNGGEPAFPLHPSVEHRHLGFDGKPSNLLCKAWQFVWRNLSLRKAIVGTKPDIVVSFIPEPNVHSIAATRGLDVPVAVCERTDPTLYKVGWKCGLLRRVTYPLADMLVCQTNAALRRFQRAIRVRGCVIPNLISVPEAWVNGRAARRTGTSGRTLVAMGRLVPEKGFDLLLKAFSDIMHRHPTWSLKILGQGALKGDLQRLTKTLNISQRVCFAGTHVEPFAELCHADLFVLSSTFEGFPNALSEAMACGLPAVSFDCPSGPRDIIRDGVDGVLVPHGDAGALAVALDDLMTDDAKRERLASRAAEIVDRFSSGRILSLWEDAFAELAPAAMRVQRAPKAAMG